ncbi:hypothetical protein [Candidatus Puniceispirillum marinum]|uniref:hypothetical protein n=1 Tax=Candidatus Puniceispirillum marinum TaxID=767892 RepID=UPI0005A4B7DC|nr:hypothetical protein [Candidatus Puniceispirillum marinum]
MRALIFILSLVLFSQITVASTVNLNCSSGTSSISGVLEINTEAKQVQFAMWPIVKYTENKSAIGWSVSRLDSDSLDVASFVLAKDTLSLQLVVLSSEVNPSKADVGVWQCVQPLR